METTQRKGLESDGMGEKAGHVARRIGEQMQSAQGPLHQEPQSRRKK